MAILKGLATLIGLAILAYVGWEIFSGLKSIASIPSAISDWFSGIVKRGQEPNKPPITSTQQQGSLSNAVTDAQSSGQIAYNKMYEEAEKAGEKRNAVDGFLHGLFPSWFY